MRAITGGVVSSEPYPLSKAARSLSWFSKSAASHLPSSDCHTYLRTAANAAKRLYWLREELGGRPRQGAANYDYENPVEGGRRHQDQESEGDLAELGKKKGKKKKNENPPEDRAVARADSHIPPSPEIATEKRRKKKHSNKEVSFDVKPEASFAVEEELVSEKKKSKKKKEKNHVKREEDVDEVEEKVVNDSAAAEQRVASTERERKKKKHKQEEGRTEVVKEEKTIADGDLSIEKKRKKKRGRGDIYDNGPEQVEHTKKKQKKHSGD